MTNKFNYKFDSPIIGTDPVTKGTFTIERAYMRTWTWNDDDYGILNPLPEAEGEIVIRGIDNPLYKVAKESPLRLQGLTASVDFGAEKRFIKIEKIEGYQIIEDGIVNEITLDPVTFVLLDNLDFVGELQDYKWDNLL